jgi:hypothetical protein
MNDRQTNESQAINSAYSSAIQGLFETLSTAFLMAKGDPAKEKAAEETFKHGLDFNRKVYSRAQAIIQAQV